MSDKAKGAWQNAGEYVIQVPDSGGGQPFLVRVRLSTLEPRSIHVSVAGRLREALAASFCDDDLR